MNCLRGRVFRDRDFLRTKEGLLFCVVGPYHPPDRVISYLKYLPDPRGKWRKGDKLYKRVMRKYTISNLLETFDLLENDYPQYSFVSSIYKITMTAVPHENIVNHFKPEMKLKELIKEARSSGLRYLHLHASESGIDIYRKAGFAEPEQVELELRIQ